MSEASALGIARIDGEHTRHRGAGQARRRSSDLFTPVSAPASPPTQPHGGDGGQKAEDDGERGAEPALRRQRLAHQLIGIRVVVKAGKPGRINWVGGYHDGNSEHENDQEAGATRGISRRAKRPAAASA